MFRLVLQLCLPNPLKPGVKNEDVVGTVPTGGAPTTSEWSIIKLPTEVWLILEIWHMFFIFLCLEWIMIDNRTWSSYHYKSYWFII